LLAASGATHHLDISIYVGQFLDATMNAPKDSDGRANPPAMFLLHSSFFIFILYWSVPCLYLYYTRVLLPTYDSTHTIYMHEFDAQIARKKIHENHYLRYVDTGQSMAGLGQWHI